MKPNSQRLKPFLCQQNEISRNVILATITLRHCRVLNEESRKVKWHTCCCQFRSYLKATRVLSQAGDLTTIRLTCDILATWKTSIPAMRVSVICAGENILCLLGINNCAASLDIFNGFNPRAKDGRTQHHRANQIKQVRISASIEIL